MVGTDQQTVQRPLLTRPPTSCVSPSHMQMCIPFRSVRNSYQVSSKLQFPGWACVTRMVGILHGRWSIRFTSPRAASNRAPPLWHLWTGWPCRKRQTCFWRSEPRLIPPNPAARHTRSLLGQFQPFAQSTGGRVLRPPSVVAAKKCPAQINTFTVLWSGGKKPWHVSSCLFLASPVANCWVTGFFPKV